MTDQQGRFVWYELMARDTEAAKAFYTKVVGWSTQDGPVPGMAYTMFTDGQTPVGGLMAQPEDARKMGAPPSWIGYVAVNDVDAAAERIKRLGGTVHVAPTDIPNVGRFSVVADPQSAVFALFNSPNTCDAPLPEPGTPGRVGWHELSAADWPKAFAFYSELFGWQKGDAMDMGAMGTYQIFSVGGQAVGGMLNKPADGAGPELALLHQRRRYRRGNRSCEDRWRPNSQWPDAGARRQLDHPGQGPAGRDVCAGRAEDLTAVRGARVYCRRGRPKLHRSRLLSLLMPDQETPAQ